MMALGRGGEDDTQVCSQLFGGKSLDHLVVPTGVKEAGPVVEFYEVPKSDDRSVFREMVFSKNDQGHALLNPGEGLQHGRSDAGKAFVRVAEDEIRDIHLVEFSGIVRPVGDAETDGSDQEKVTGEEFEIGLDGIGNIGVVVVTQGSSPEKGCSKEASEDKDEHESRGEKTGGGVGGEFGKELPKVLFVLHELDGRENAERDEKILDRETGGSLDERVALPESRTKGNGSHDLIEGADSAGRFGGAEPECRSGEKENELETFHDTIFGWKSGVVWKPCGEKDGDGAKDHQNGREERVFPWLPGSLFHD